MEVIHFIKYKDRPNDRAVGWKSTSFKPAFFPVHAHSPWLPYVGLNGNYYFIGS